MYVCMCIIFILNFAIFNKGMPLEKEEWMIAIDLIKALKIRHAILIDDDSNPINLYEFKNLSSNIPTGLTTKQEFGDYLMDKNFVDVKTIIIFKSIEFHEFDEFNLLFVALKFGKMYFTMSHFTWLIFTPELYDVKFSAPYDCQFIYAYQHLNIYKLREVYDFGFDTVKSDYGTWDLKNGLKIKNESVYYRRIDMNQTSFMAIEDIDFKDCLKPRMLRYRNCNYIKIVRDITSNLNFQYTTVTNKEIEENDALSGLLYALNFELSERWINLNQITEEFSSSLHYFPKNKLRWFIKYPEGIHLLNYYARSFDGPLWKAIHWTVAVGGVIIVLIQFFHTYVLKITREFNFGSSIFKAADAFLNQGGKVEDKASFRIAFIIFRFTALFILPAYSADFTALLSIQKPAVEFEDLDKFVENGEYKMLIPGGEDSINIYFNEKTGNIGREIVKKFSKNYNTFEEGLNLLCSSGRKYAFPIYNHPNVFGTSCDVYQIKKPLANDHHFGFVLGLEGASSPYVRILNHKLLKLLEGGVIQKIEVLDSDDEFSLPRKKHFSPVGLFQISQIILVAILSLGVSWVFLILELTAKRFSKWLRGKMRRKLTKNI